MIEIGCGLCFLAKTPYIGFEEVTYHFIKAKVDDVFRIEAVFP